MKTAPFDSLVWGSVRLTPIICIVLKLSVRDIAIQRDFPNKTDQCIQSSTETILLFAGSALYGLNILKKVHLLCSNCIWYPTYNIQSWIFPSSAASLITILNAGTIFFCSVGKSPVSLISVSMRGVSLKRWQVCKQDTIQAGTYLQ